MKIKYFTFWLSNKSYWEYKLAEWQIKEKLTVFLSGVSISILQETADNLIVTHFICDSDPGLESIYEKKEFDDLVEFCKPIIKNFIKENSI